MLKPGTKTRTCTLQNCFQFKTQNNLSFRDFFCPGFSERNNSKQTFIHKSHSHIYFANKSHPENLRQADFLSPEIGMKGNKTHTYTQNKLTHTRIYTQAEHAIYKFCIHSLLIHFITHTYTCALCI